MVHYAKRGQRIVEIAEKWIGIPYSRDPDQGIDCSHLVYEVYKEAGLPYPYATTNEFVKKADPYFQKVDVPSEGDVVLYESHMGIYTKGQIISARSGLGRVDYGQLNYFKGFLGFYRYR
jgi:cell wall-associated NlpC family hydrolase